jgi:hypothetical protein
MEEKTMNGVSRWRETIDNPSEWHAVALSEETTDNRRVYRLMSMEPDIFYYETGIVLVDVDEYESMLYKVEELERLRRICYD